MDAWLQTAFDTVIKHIPANLAWTPLAATGLVLLVGLTLLMKGARLAPLVGALAFLVVAGAGGALVSRWIGTPLWPTLTLGGVAGFLLGLLFFRLWQAVLVAGCFAGASLLVYTLRIVSPHIDQYASQGFDASQGVTGITIPAEGSSVAAAGSIAAELEQLWGYLAARIPSFQTSLGAITISAGLAGLLFGLLLPRASRALFAATAGTVCCVLALSAGVKVLAPHVLAWLSPHGAWCWAAIGILWLLGFAHNLRDMRGPRTKPAPREEAPAARTAPA